MAQVTFPNKFFLFEAKKEYYNYQERLICEIIQNSYDAKSTKIEIELGDNCYQIIDNGNGMSKERMVLVLLTMGGTEKETNSTGGFGAAKKLILLAHKNYEIHSLNAHVLGEQLNYEFIEDGLFFNGTKVKCEFLPEWQYEKEPTIEIIKNFLRKCNLNCDVFINGELFTEYTVYNLGREMDWANLYVGKDEKYSNYVNIRHNGLFMFSSYIENLNKEVILEVKGESVEIFTQNRDGFRGKYRDYFSALVNEINMDKRSFTRPNLIRKFYIKGRNGLISIFSNKQRENIQIPNDPIMAYLSAKKVGNDNFFVLNKNVEVIENFSFENDFVYDLTNSEYEEIPYEFSPKTMLRRYKFLTALWKQSILEILRVNDIDGEFVIGFTFSKETDAIYFKEKDGPGGFLINPEKERFIKGKARERFYNIFSTALHEVVHFEGYSFHDESFANKLTNNMSETLIKYSGWREICNRARLEIS